MEVFVLSVLGFLIILGPLVIFHELGHYFFARLFNVKAEVFSIGFGPKLWSKQLGETELRIAAIPLGGFVKLLGEDGETELSPEDQKRALQRQSAWKRFFIFFGGPLFNFILAILIFMVILAIGEEQLANVAGRVVRDSVAEQAGFQSGDHILAVNGKPVKKYEEVMNEVNEHPEKDVTFEVKHPGDEKSRSITVKTTSMPGYTVFGEPRMVGEVDGLLPMARAGVVGISNPSSAAAQAGFKSGDRIVQMNGKDLKDWEELERSYAVLPTGAQLTFKVEAKGAKEGEKGEAREISMTKPSPEPNLGLALGLHSSELFVEKAVEGSPAEKAGVVKGDRMVAIAEQSVNSFFDLKSAVQKAGEKDGKVLVQWERNGEVLSATITPTATSTKDPELKKITTFTVGIMPMLEYAQPATLTERVLNPFMLLYKGTERMVVFTYRNVVSLGKIVTGDVSMGTLGGPILIGKLAGESLARGLISFLTMMAILSVGLGVLNILPVPVLDGGHLLLLGIEAVRGKPLTIRQMEIVQQVGLSLILLLMVVVFKNDLSRLSIFN